MHFEDGRVRFFAKLLASRSRPRLPRGYNAVIGVGVYAAKPVRNLRIRSTRTRRPPAEFRINKERRVLEAGGIAAIPGGVEHEGWCQEDTEVIDIFAPPREDFLAGGGPTWLRGK